MLICNRSVVPSCLLLRFDWMLPRGARLTKSDLHCLSVRALLMAKIGNGNDCGLYQHEVYRCPSGSIWRSGLLLQATTGWFWPFILCLPRTVCWQLAFSGRVPPFFSPPWIRTLISGAWQWTLPSMWCRQESDGHVSKDLGFLLLPPDGPLCSSCCFVLCDIMFFYYIYYVAQIS